MVADADEFIDDIKNSSEQSLETSENKSGEELEDLENIVSVFLTRLRNLSTELNHDGQLSREGYGKVMNLIDEYWRERRTRGPRMTMEPVGLFTTLGTRFLSRKPILNSPSKSPEILFKLNAERG